MFSAFGLPGQCELGQENAPASLLWWGSNKKVGRMQLPSFISKIFSPRASLGGIRFTSFDDLFYNSVPETKALQLAAVWRCVSLISDAIATMPLDLIEKVSENERRPANLHPLNNVLTVKPNSWQTPGEFKRLLQTQLLLRGNAYARIVRLGGKVLALHPIQPDSVQVEQRDDLTLVYKVYLSSGEQIEIPQNNMLHLRGLSLDGVTGISVLAQIKNSVALAVDAESAGMSLFRHGSMAGGLLRHPGRLSDDAAKRLESSWNSGSARAGSAKLLEEGMTFERLGITADEAQFLETRQFQAQDICMFFGVPPHMAGLTDKTTSWGTGIEAQNIGFLTYTLSNWIRVWEEAITRDLLPHQDQGRIQPKFNEASLLRGDVKTRWTAYVAGLQWGALSPNEVRALEDLNPREGGDIFYSPPNTAGEPPK